jgi:predicted AAA+ superfamily ATPase
LKSEITSKILIERTHFIHLIHELFEIHSVCAILGPRQCGKTTLARLYAGKYNRPLSTLATEEQVLEAHGAQNRSLHLVGEDSSTGATTQLPAEVEFRKRSNIGEVHYFDLENPKDIDALSSPSLVLEPLNGLIIIDEIQRRPDLFPYLRYLTDYSDKKFLILGSASRDLIQQSSETLAGRISYIELTPLALWESVEFKQHWERGGFPKSYLASSDKNSQRWREDYIATFLERDLANIGFQMNPYLMRKLWTMIAHYHGQTANYSEIGRSLDLTDKTIKHYLEVLEATFMIRMLKPWHENLKKRQIKSPKLYIRDSGLLHALLDITPSTLITHPKVGASWEGYALEEVIRKLDPSNQQVYFWRTETGAELDLLVIRGDKRYGFEFKFSDAPQITSSMRIAMEDLKRSKITVINPGTHAYKKDDAISVVGLERFIAESK